MQPYLKLAAEELTELTVSPELLLAHLEKHLATFDTLLKDLHCTPDDLTQTLADPKTANLVKLKAHIALLQLQLLATQYVPHAFAKLVNLMNTAEKPEVARRASTTILQIAGMPTRTTAQEPAPPPEPPKIKPEEIDDTQRSELMRAVTYVLVLKRAHSIPLENISEADFPRFVDTLKAFLQTCPDFKFAGPYMDNPSPEARGIKTPPTQPPQPPKPA